MYIPNPYFKNVPKIGNLILDYIFVENGYPILFVCKTEENDLYICLCREIYGRQKWVISEINLNILEKLIQNKISVYDAFKKHEGKAALIFWSREKTSEDYTVFSSCKDIEDKDLPDKDFYLDDEGESEGYLQQVKNRIDNDNFNNVEIRLFQTEAGPVYTTIKREIETKEIIIEATKNDLSVKTRFAANKEFENLLKQKKMSKDFKEIKVSTSATLNVIAS